MPALDPVYIMIQKNCLKIQEGNTLEMQFDLKGSSFTRQSLPNYAFNFKCSDQETCSYVPKRLSELIKKIGETLKDCDFLKLKKNCPNFNINISVKEQMVIHLALKHDIEFLQK